MTATDRSLVLAELEQRLQRLQAVFDLSTLDGAGENAANISAYYVQSRLGYRLVHSLGGAMHMALNPDGKFGREGYSGQVREIALTLNADERVLEIAMGNGFNLQWLAARHPQVIFHGIDLVDTHVRQALKNTKGLANAYPTRGDFHKLPFADCSFDCVYAIEGLCHATDMASALREAYRVSVAGGRFIVFDGWRASNFENLEPTAQRAAALVEAAMAVGAPTGIDLWRTQVVASGWRITSEVDYTNSIVPNLQRFAGLAEQYLSYPRAARFSQQLLPIRLLTNAVAAYLMPLCIEIGAHTYRAFTLERPYSV